MKKIDTMTLYDFEQEHIRLIKKLNDSTDELRQAGIDEAQAERDYRVAVAQATLKLRADGVPVGIIDKIIRGIDEVEGVKLKRDIAKAKVLAIRESIQTIKYEIQYIADEKKAMRQGV